MVEQRAKGTARAAAARLLGRVAWDVRAIAVVAVAACTASYLQARPLPLVVYLLLLPVCLWRWPGRMLVLTALLASVWTNWDIQQHLNSRWPAARSGETVTLSGRVAGLVDQDRYRARFVLARETPPYRTRLSWYDAADTLRPGDCVTAAAKLDAPHGSANPGTFDYEGWLWRERIDATGYIRRMGACDQSPRHSIDRWRALALERLEDMLEGSPMGGLIAALTLGARGDISDAQWDVLRATGTSHLVAISGLHIGLIAAWLYVLGRWLALRLWPRGPVLTLAAAAAVSGALVYALLAGLALPTQRALVMVGVALVAVVAMRRIAPSRVLALAAIAVLLWSPTAVIAPGFWLSFGAVAWLIYLSRWVRRRRFAGFVVLQLGLVAGLAPLTLGWFGQASLVAPLVNALLIPAAALVIPALLAVFLLALVWPGAGAPLLQAAAAGMNWVWPVLEAVAHWPWAAVQPGFPGVLALILAMIAVALALLPAGLPGRWLAPVLILPALLGWRPDADAIAPGGYRLSMLDVGQGLAIVVRTRDHTLIYDAGPAYRTGFDAGEAFVVPYMRHIGRTQVDRLIISHGDIDHAGGAQAVESALTVAQRIGAGGRACRAGETWDWDGVRFAFLYPRAGDLNTEAASNARSCVLRIQGAGGVTLLPGDIEAATEAMLLARDPTALDADMLVVAHHGSASSSSAAFLAAVSPRVALISAGWQNRWGFPDARVVERLHEAGARVVDTATAGQITVRMPPRAQRIEVETWRERSPRIWHLP